MKVKIAKTTKPSLAAGAVAAYIRSNRMCRVCAIGGRAMVRSLYAMQMAARFLAEEGVYIAIHPIFEKIEVGKPPYYEFLVCTIDDDHVPLQFQERAGIRRMNWSGVEADRGND